MSTRADCLLYNAMWCKSAVVHFKCHSAGADKGLTVPVSHHTRIEHISGQGRQNTWPHWSSSSGDKKDIKKHLIMINDVCKIYKTGIYSQMWCLPGQSLFHLWECWTWWRGRHCSCRWLLSLCIERERTKEKMCEENWILKMVPKNSQSKTNQS